MKWQPKELMREQTAERRAEGGRLLESGEKSQVEIVRYLGVSEATVSRWKKAMQEGGKEALQARKPSGRPPKLNAKEKQQLVKKLEQRAQASGFPMEQWTQARIQHVIKQEFGVDYHRDYIGHLLHGLGWSVQKPDPRALERDEELIRAWLSRDWVRTKKA
jgi:transposase